MRRSQEPIKTRHQAPANETARNAQLLIRAGYISKEMAGVYSYLPLGLRVINKIIEIIRQEMNAIGGVELSLSTLQDPVLWQKTDRWSDQKVDAWFKTKLKSGREIGLGLTHEEPLVRILAQHIRSHKDLPALYYQFQTKFRNELRARSGLIRGREFLMKDLYSFAEDEEQHLMLYERVATSYEKIFQRLGLGEITYRAYASGGPFSSQYSEEFQTVCAFGEDTIFVQHKSKLAINEEACSDEILDELKMDKKDLTEQKAVEVGNIFHLGTKYSEPLELRAAGSGGNRPVVMGSYGIGVSRLMGLIAELFSDDKGLIWPEQISPYRIYLATLNPDENIKRAAEETYQRLNQAGLEVIYDDREASPGEKFADADLWGLPIRMVISAKTMQQNGAEIKYRNSEDCAIIALDELAHYLQKNRG